MEPDREIDHGPRTEKDRLSVARAIAAAALGKEGMGERRTPALYWIAARLRTAIIAGTPWRTWIEIGEIARRSSTARHAQELARQRAHLEAARHLWHVGDEAIRLIEENTRDVHVRAAARELRRRLNVRGYPA